MSSRNMPAECFLPKMLSEGSQPLSWSHRKAILKSRKKQWDWPRTRPEVPEVLKFLHDVTTLGLQNKGVWVSVLLSGLGKGGFSLSKENKLYIKWHTGIYPCTRLATSMRTCENTLYVCFDKYNKLPKTLENKFHFTAMVCNWKIQYKLLSMKFYF